MDRRLIAAAGLLLLAGMLTGSRAAAAADCRSLTPTDGTPAHDTRQVEFGWDGPWYGWDCVFYEDGLEVAGQGLGWWP